MVQIVGADGGCLDFLSRLSYLFSHSGRELNIN